MTSTSKAKNKIKKNPKKNPKQNSKKQFSIFPQGNVLYRNLFKKYPLASKASGPYIWDKSGKKYFDASGGALVMSLGHSNKFVLNEYFKSLRKITYVNGMQFSTEVLELFCEKLCGYLPKKLEPRKVALLGSGSEAVEAAIKFVRQLWVERNQPERQVFLARSPGYHGNTLYALSASARPYYRKFFGPLLSEVVMLSAPYEYRPLGTSDFQKSTQNYVDEFEKTIQKIGPSKIAGFIAETVGGSSTGATSPPPGYFEALQSVCKKYGILIIADEVMCGAGRTGTFFAFEQFHLDPDVVVLGKGINSGLMPVSAMIVKESHVQEMKLGSGGFMHAQTYMQVPSAAAAGLAVLNCFEKHKVLQNVRTLGRYFLSELKKVTQKYDFVGHVSGVGLFAGVEFVKNIQTKDPFPRSQKVAEKFVELAFENGLVVWPNTSQADGTHGDLFMLGPPLNVKKTELQDMFKKIDKSLADLQKVLEK